MKKMKHGIIGGLTALMLGLVGSAHALTVTVNASNRVKTDTDTLAGSGSVAFRTEWDDVGSAHTITNVALQPGKSFKSRLTVNCSGLGALPGTVQNVNAAFSAIQGTFAAQCPFYFLSFATFSEGEVSVNP